MLLNKGYFAINIERGHERYNDAWNKEPVIASGGTSCVIPLVQGVAEGPSIVCKSSARATEVPCVARARRLAFRLRFENAVVGFNLNNVATVCSWSAGCKRTESLSPTAFNAILHASCHEAIFRASIQAYLWGIGVGQIDFVFPDLSIRRLSITVLAFGRQN